MISLFAVLSIFKFTASSLTKSITPLGAKSNVSSNCSTLPSVNKVLTEFSS